MAEAVSAAPAVAPSATPEPAAPAAPAAAPATPAVNEWEAKWKAAQAERDRSVRERVVERRKFEGQIRQMNERMKALEALEQQQKMARLNPEAYLKNVYGDNWYDTIVSTKLNGVPPADLLAAEMTKMREEFTGELSKRDAAAQAAMQRQQQAQLEASVREVTGSMEAFVSQKSDAYPALIERYGNPKSVADALFKHARAEWDKTVQYDARGVVSQPGKVLSAKEAADALEAQERAIVEKISGRLTPKQTSAPIGGPKLVSSQQQQVPQSQQQQRRTLSNDIVGSTPGRQPASTAAEKRLKAIAAFNAARKS
jgi:hypothetical protein